MILDREQINRATIGTGTIAVLNTASNLVGAIRTGADAVNTVVNNDFKNNGDDASTGLKGVSTEWKPWKYESYGRICKRAWNRVYI